ncbi:MAG: UDP-N-acetylglucosamine--N-acetylmuramyl-(pentapeptide) pyrophosphoryl-undecaprenol N-acetylglucosamine transferase [Opitutales bacterium]
MCGGTGGHLSPGIALAERLTRRGHTCHLVVSRKEIDSRLSAKYAQLSFIAVPGAAFSLRPAGLLRFGWNFARSFVRAGSLLAQHRPDATIVFGGFMSPPFVLWSRLRGVGVAIHEANRRPGRAVRFLSRLAHRVYLPPGVRLRGVRRSHVVPCGYPLRREIRHLRKEEARRRWGIENRHKTLVIVGGSQGAMALNDWVNTHYPKLASEGLNVIAVSGPGKGVASTLEVETAQGDTVKLWFLPFADDMSLLRSVADLVISRAGAGAIAELTACLAPSILVPYPHAADQHQAANADYFEKQGACLVLPQEKMQERLTTEVRQLIFNDNLLHRLRGNLRALDRGEAAARMADDLEKWIAGLRPAALAPAARPTKEEARS